MKHPIPWTLLALLLLPLVGVGAQPPVTPEETATIRQILALETEIEALMETLSPAARQALERWRQGIEPEPASPPSPPPHPAAVPAPTVAPPTSAPIPTAPPPLPPPRRGRCNALKVFDDNRDGVLDAADGVWRFLYLWNDRNGNGQVDKKEVDSAFARGVRTIAADLGSFEHKKGWAGDIDVTDTVTFDFARKDQPVLVIEAGDFNRGDGGPKLQGPDGQPLTGTLPFTGGWQLVYPDGTRVTLDCP
jgi:hypothetical protein